LTDNDSSNSLGLGVARHETSGTIAREVTAIVAIMYLAMRATIGWSTIPAGAAEQSAAGPNRLALTGTPVDVVSGLAIPWSVVFARGEALISQRDAATIVAFRPGEAPRTVGRVPDVTASIDGGLLGLAILDRGGDVWVYAYHSTPSDNRIVRMRYADGALGNAAVVLKGLAGGSGHNAGRIAFGPDGMLYVTVGDSRNPALSQNPDALGGKILRMTPEGQVPADNPRQGSLVYALGLRNPQGLAWDDQGQLWATDFGDKGWDELNRIKPGRNYGWPVIEGRGDNPAYVDPVVQWRTSEMGPSGLAYVNGTFFIAGLTGQRLWSVAFDSTGRPVTTEHFVNTYGRIRDVIEAPDGRLWFVTNNTGRRQTQRPGDDRVLSVQLTRRGS
jgi:glucose/arabinose dehydrogenase